MRRPEQRARASKLMMGDNNPMKNPEVVAKMNLTTKERRDKGLIVDQKGEDCHQSTLSNYDAVLIRHLYDFYEDFTESSIKTPIHDMIAAWFDSNRLIVQRVIKNMTFKHVKPTIKVLNVEVVGEKYV
jgi:L-cysteine desulfidase